MTLWKGLKGDEKRSRECCGGYWLELWRGRDLVGFPETATGKRYFYGVCCGGDKSLVLNINAVIGVRLASYADCMRMRATRRF